MTGPQDDLDTETIDEYDRFVWRKVLFLSLLLFSIGFLVAAAATIGPIALSIEDIYKTILSRFASELFEINETSSIVIWNIRLPRILMGLVAGFGLGIAGAVMQGILRNPLASPYTLGISSGAGFGAALAIIFGAGLVGGEYLIVVNALIFSLLCSMIILGLASRKGATPETLILAGIAMMYFFSACTTLLEFFADPDAVKAVVFWMAGSLAKSTWPKVFLTSLVLVLTVPFLLWRSWDMNVIGSGDDTARSLGINVYRTRLSLMVVVSLITASVVCFTGAIAFVGLVSPHITRMVIGGDNRFVLPASGLLGGLILVASDIVAMNVIAPVVIPIGVMTAFLGVPLFFYLINRRRREYW